MNTTYRTIREIVDYILTLLKDKGGTFIVGTVIGGGLGFSFYDAERTVRGYAESENKRLTKELVDCREGREKDRDGFFDTVREFYEFSESLRSGYKKAEINSREAAAEKEEKLKTFR